MRPNYAFNPIAEQALRSNQTIVPQRVNAALGFWTKELEYCWEANIVRNVLRQSLVLVGLLLLPCGNGVAAERAEEVVYIQWDAMYVVIVKGELIESEDNKESQARIFLDSAPGSFRINEQTKNNGSVLTPGVPFEFKYQFFWGGVYVEGEEREEPDLAFRLRIQGENGKCLISDSAPTEENEKGGVMTLDIGQFVLETPCNG